MRYRVNFSETAKRQLKKLDAFTQKAILKYVTEKLEGIDSPRTQGKALKGSFKGLWRYDTGKYRLICQIEDGKLQILIIKIGHRREVYR
ncbi:MAG: type II toxin-antitoxin system RelE/ParE family toxin [Defluviitaleaceae bacterium]|nr:type II toxin-antitoxin system RelE/ParE family toxin [Defluviitaleaceae bacterium]